MANEIHNYPIEVYTIQDEDFLDMDVWNGVSFDTAKISGASVKDTMTQIFDKQYVSMDNPVTMTQTAINTPKAMVFGSVLSINNGFGLYQDGFGQNTILRANKSGVFNLQFSAQIERLTGGSAQTLDIWLKLNGSNVPNSNTSVNVVANSGKLVASWNFMFNLNAGQDIQLMWAVTSVDIVLKAEAITGVHPATPSLITTIQQV